MAGIDLQAAERFVSESALVPTACHSLTGGSSNPPKFGTLIPNRIFVGGIPSNTTEQELKSFFSSFGQVKDVKIISDRLGVSKGSYGFVTFESQEMAEKIIKNESETLIFKDRKLNIGHAIRKQQMFPRTDIPTALFFAGGAMPYGFQNGMALFSIPGQDYPVLTQAATPYATMMLPQPGSGTALYLPSSLHSAAPTAATPYGSLSQQQIAAAALQQQQFPATGHATAINAAVAAQLNPIAANPTNLGTQTNSTAAVMAAAAAAMAAAAQWPQQPNGNHQTSHQLTNASSANASQSAAGPQTVVQNASITPQQAAAVAAAMAAQQATWRWSPVQHQTQVSHITTCSNHATNNGTSITASASLSNSTSTPTVSNANLHSTHQQGSPTAALGPATYLYSPIAATAHELMFFHQTSSPFTANSTSDYSTDHSTHSSGLLESVEPLSFACEGTPLGRHSHQLPGQLTSGLSGPHLDPSCLSPYTAFGPILDLQSHNSASGQPSTLIHSTNLHQQFRQPQQQQTSTILTAPQAASAQHFLPIAHAATTLLPQQHTKIYSPSVLSAVSLSGQSMGGVSGCSLPSSLFGTPSMKSTNLSDISVGDATDPAILSQQSGTQNAGNSVNSSLPQSTTAGAGQCNSGVSNLSTENAVNVGAIHR